MGACVSLKRGHAVAASSGSPGVAGPSAALLEGHGRPLPQRDLAPAWRVGLRTRRSEAQSAALGVLRWPLPPRPAPGVPSLPEGALFARSWEPAPVGRCSLVSSSFLSRAALERDFPPRARFPLEEGCLVRWLSSCAGSAASDRPASGRLRAAGAWLRALPHPCPTSPLRVSSAQSPEP